MIRLIAFLVGISMAATACAQGVRIPEDDWFEQQRRNPSYVDRGGKLVREKLAPRCKPSTIVVERVVYVRTPQLVFVGWIWNGFQYVPAYQWQ